MTPMRCQLRFSFVCFFRRVQAARSAPGKNDLSELQKGPKGPICIQPIEENSTTDENGLRIQNVVSLSKEERKKKEAMMRESTEHMSPNLVQARQALQSSLMASNDTEAEATERKFKTQMVLLQRKTNKPVSEQSEAQLLSIPHLLEINTNCVWEQIRSAFLSHMASMLEDIDYPKPCTFHMEHFLVQILPKPEKPTPLPPNLRKEFHKYKMYAIRICISEDRYRVPKSVPHDVPVSQPTPPPPKLFELQKSRTLRKMSPSEFPEKPSTPVTSASSSNIGLSGLSSLRVSAPGLQKMSSSESSNRPSPPITSASSPGISLSGLSSLRVSAPGLLAMQSASSITPTSTMASLQSTHSTTTPSSQSPIMTTSLQSPIHTAGSTSPETNMTSSDSLYNTVTICQTSGGVTTMRLDNKRPPEDPAVPAKRRASQEAGPADGASKPILYKISGSSISPVAAVVPASTPASSVAASPPITATPLPPLHSIRHRMPVQTGVLRPGISLIPVGASQPHGGPPSIKIPLAALTTSHQGQTQILRLPANLPAGVRLAGMPGLRVISMPNRPVMPTPTRPIRTTIVRPSLPTDTQLLHLPPGFQVAHFKGKLPPALSRMPLCIAASHIKLKGPVVGHLVTDKGIPLPVYVQAIPPQPGDLPNTPKRLMSVIQATVAGAADLQAVAGQSTELLSTADNPINLDNDEEESAEESEAEDGDGEAAKTEKLQVDKDGDTATRADSPTADSPPARNTTSPATTESEHLAKKDVAEQSSESPGNSEPTGNDQMDTEESTEKIPGQTEHTDNNHTTSDVTEPSTLSHGDTVRQTGDDQMEKDATEDSSSSPPDTEHADGDPALKDVTEQSSEKPENTGGKQTEKDTTVESTGSSVETEPSVSNKLLKQVTEESSCSAPSSPLVVEAQQSTNGDSPAQLDGTTVAQPVAAGKPCPKQQNSHIDKDGEQKQCNSPADKGSSQEDPISAGLSHCRSSTEAAPAITSDKATSRQPEAAEVNSDDKSAASSVKDNGDTNQENSEDCTESEEPLTTDMEQYGEATSPAAAVNNSEQEELLEAFMQQKRAIEAAHVPRTVKDGQDAIVDSEARPAGSQTLSSQQDGSLLKNILTSAQPVYRATPSPQLSSMSHAASQDSQTNQSSMDGASYLSISSDSGPTRRGRTGSFSDFSDIIDIEDTDDVSK